MSLPVIAIVVSTASALFTASNVLISLFTYRRVRPRVALKVRYAPIAPERSINENGSVSMFNAFHVHVINRGQTTVKVHNAVGEYRVPSAGNRLWARHSVWPSYFKFEQGQGDSEIPPFGGIRWVLTKTFMLLPGMWLKGRVKVRIRVTLTNGREVHSRWMKLSRLEEQDQQLYEAVLGEMAEPLAAHEQLSLFDGVQED